MRCDSNSKECGDVTSWRALLVATALISAVGLAVAGSVTYTYDSLGRLATATYSNGLVVGFQYDLTGNRTSYVISGAAP